MMRRLAFGGLLTGAVVSALSAPVRTVMAQAAPAPASQNPSPMVDETRAHERLAQRDVPGRHLTFTGPQNKPVDLYIPDGIRRADSLHLIVHFLGASWLPAYAASTLPGKPVMAVVNIGAGSGIYDRSFSDPAALDSLLANVERETARALGTRTRVARLTLSGFSAGHGAIRAILRDPRQFARVDDVLLLDGMHTSYVPEGTPLEKGGTLDPSNLDALVRFAKAAVRGEKHFIVTHSEIFPGTFASTTETADYLLRALNLRRTPVVRWGPRGMQQLSEAHAGNFELMGFAGNTAPDHIDQLHGMPEFLARAVGGAMGGVADLETTIRARLDSLQAHGTFYAKDLTTGREVAVRADEPMNTASVIKIPVMILAFRDADAGKLDLNERYTIRAEDARGGTGLLRTFAPGVQPTMLDLITQMIITSDNTATDIMIAKVGMQRVNRMLDSLGYRDTRLRMTVGEVLKAPQSYRPALADTSAAARSFAFVLDSTMWLGRTTAREISRLLEQIERGQLASSKSTAEMRRILRAQLYTSRLPQRVRFRVTMGHKTGDWPPILGNDVGIMYAPSGPIVMGVFTNANTGSFFDLEATEGRIAEDILNAWGGSSPVRR